MMPFTGIENKQKKIKKNRKKKIHQRVLTHPWY